MYNSGSLEGLSVEIITIDVNCHFSIEISIDVY
jgi:hypothetical protein